MKWLWTSLCAAALAGAMLRSAGPVGGTNSAPNQPARILEKPVTSYRVRGLTALDALLHLGRQEHMPLAAEYVDLRAVTKPIDLDVGKTTVAGILRALFSPDQGYIWEVRDGVLVIGHVGLPSGSKNLLDRVLPEFDVPRCTLQEASHLLWMSLYQQLHPGTGGVVGDYSPGNTKRVIGPLKMRGVTIRDALNRLVTQYMDAAWVVRVPPGRLDQLPSDGLWTIVEYDDPNLNAEVQAIRTGLLQCDGSRPGTPSSHAH